MTRFHSGYLALATAIVLLAACTQPLSPPPPVPPSQAEAMPLPPISPVDLVWRPGHWNWDGNGYRWISGQYEPRTDQTVMWRSGYWQQTPNGWTWQPPGWM